jgi:hypothetical protein
MSRNYIIAGVVIVLLIALGGGYMMMNRNSEAPAATSENTSPAPEAQASVTTEKSSLKNFMSMQGDRQCQFNDPETGNSGTVFLNSGKMRGDFSSTVNGKVTASHMINDGKDAYIWMDDQTTGFKTNLEAIEKMSGQTGVQQTVDINKQVDYKCTGWTPDPVKFAVPTEIKFQDMSKMMEDAMKRMPNTSPNASAVSADDSKEACAACDNLEGESKDQCKRALKCN